MHFILLKKGNYVKLWVVGGVFILIIKYKRVKVKFCQIKITNMGGKIYPSSVPKDFTYYIYIDITHCIKEKLIYKTYC